MADYDGSVIYVNLRNAQRLCQVGKTVSGFDILVSNTDSLASLAQQIPEYLGIHIMPEQCSNNTEIYLPGSIFSEFQY